jgi:hypothetical protein
VADGTTNYKNLAAVKNFLRAAYDYQFFDGKYREQID